MSESKKLCILRKELARTKIARRRATKMYWQWDREAERLWHREIVLSDRLWRELAKERAKR